MQHSNLKKRKSNKNLGNLRARIRENLIKNISLGNIQQKTKA